MKANMNTSPDLNSRYALLSVSDKTGISDLAARLQALGFQLLSTGGTARLLAESGITVTEVSTHTGFPEIMEGRVKTLHPRIHGGLLGRDQDQDVMRQHDIPPIDLLAVNLYPFEAVTDADDCSLHDAVENIDIGGPAMLRAAAKNHARVAVVCDPSDYDRVLSELEQQGEVSGDTRFELATRAFAHTARYDGIVSSWLSGKGRGDSGDVVLPQYLTPQFHRSLDLRYGENPHQAAAFYVDAGASRHGIADAQQLQGKELSFNNINDADAALACIGQFDDEPACVIVKHANPCGVATAGSLAQAYDRAFATDPVSSFGGIIAFNRELDAQTVDDILARQFVEVVLAPVISSAARERFQDTPNVGVLETGSDANGRTDWDFRRVSGGLLVQQADIAVVTPADCRCVSERKPTETEWEDLMFAWKIAHMVKSNAIVYAAGGRTLGVGAGQMSRVDSARIARWKASDAKLELKGAVMASDAFFPFRDGIDTAAEAGIAAVIQPGGSMRDEEVIAAANEHDIAMVFTGIRHFRH
jgi:phosphoribosylaminoimidazolecarboxamide formyltransferase/IMP cyclohydrolase